MGLPMHVQLMNRCQRQHVNVQTARKVFSLRSRVARRYPSARRLPWGSHVCAPCQRARQHLSNGRASRMPQCTRTIQPGRPLQIMAFYSHIFMSTLILDVRAWGVFRDEVAGRAAALLLSELAAAAYDAPKKYSRAEVLRVGRVVVVKDYVPNFGTVLFVHGLSLKSQVGQGTVGTDGHQTKDLEEADSCFIQRTTPWGDL
eukprot:3472264-Amphidinium_carterae.1